MRDTLRFFEHVNGRVADDPRVALIIDDGARYLRRASETYDVITLEPPPPRAPGASSLYSTEFYEAARARLRPGGAIAQWLPLHGMSGAELEPLARTFVRVFPSASLHVSERNEAVLLAVRGDAVARAAAAPERWARARERAPATAIGLEARDPLRDTFLLGGPALARAVDRDARVVRDLWPMPEYAPLAGATDAAAPADRFVERLVAASEAEQGSFAALLGPAVPAFLRIERQRGQPSDRERVTAAMRGWLDRDPASAYVQHAFGFGPLLEARLDRLVRDREIDQVAASAVRARMESARASAHAAP